MISFFGKLDPRGGKMNQRERDHLVLYNACYTKLVVEVCTR